MKITIAERFHPFSHANGTKFLLPKTAMVIQVFPTRLYFTDLENRFKPFDISFDFVGPLKDFTAELDLEKGQLRVFGTTKKGYMRFSICAKPDGIWLMMEKTPEGKVACRRSSPPEKHSLSKAESMLISPPFEESCQEAGSERLSLGMHKAQEWESICRRLDFKEIFPLWLALCAQVPTTTQVGTGGNYSLLEECRQRIDERDRVGVLEAFEAFFLASFEGVLTPRLFDTEHQGIASVTGEAISPLPLLTEGGRLIRSLFVQETAGELAILPCLPTAFECGRMTGIQTSRNDVVDFEWTKKFLRRMRITSVLGRELTLRLPKGIASFRCKKGRTTMKKMHVDREGRVVLTLGANQTLHLDRFEV